MSLQKKHGIPRVVRYGRKGFDELIRSVKSDTARTSAFPVLFTGPPGTGKVKSAEVMAVELKLDMHHIDLSTVISKYSGETEKNLARIFNQASSGNSILFLDEADALFGRRTEIKDDHDRYANMETRYLLQKLETCEGVVILATDHCKNIDEACIRYMRFIVDFRFPEVNYGRHQIAGEYNVNSEISDIFIKGVESGTAVFVGKAEAGDIDRPILITSWNDFVNTFGTYTFEKPYLASAVYGFFSNGGSRCFVVRVNDDATDGDYIGLNEGHGKGKGLQACNEIDEIRIVCIPGVTSKAVQHAMITHCESRKDRFCILDSEKGADITKIEAQKNKVVSAHGYGALYYPWIKTDMETVKSGVTTVIRDIVPPSGHIAGIYSRTEREQGIHKSPVSDISNAVELETTVTEKEQHALDSEGINCIRFIPGVGIHIVNARTLSHDDEWKHINIRRLLTFIEVSILKGIKAVVLESHNEPALRRVRDSVSGFLTNVWRAGALEGTKREEAFFIKLERANITCSDIDNGRVIMEVGVAPVRPAEFIISRIVLWRNGSSID